MDSDNQLEDDVDEENESEEETEYRLPINQKRMRRDNDADNDDRLYCFCQQVSYGDMVACDGAVSYCCIYIYIYKCICFNIYLELSL